MKKPLILYHFTCEHGHAGITKTGRILPNPHPLMPALGPLIWLTDYAEPPSKESVGLTSSWSTCNRLQYRYIVYAKAVHWSEVRARASRSVVETLESFGEPAHWWLVRRPLLPSEFTLDTDYIARSYEEVVR